MTPCRVNPHRCRAALKSILPSRFHCPLTLLSVGALPLTASHHEHRTDPR
jgi:hypothetical protein